MRQLIRSLTVLLAAWFLAAAAHAEVFQGEEIEVELVSESANAVPGETLWVAVRLDPTEGWHTYSKWLGDSGDPTVIHEWQLPAGATAGEIHWPAPEWVPFPGSDLVTFSYEREVLLPVPVEVPADFQGDSFPMSAHVEWQVCERICLIGDATLDLELPVEGDSLQPHPQWADAFAETRERWPQTDHDLEALFATAGDRVSFSFGSDRQQFSDVRDAWFFPESRRVLSPGPLRDVTVLPGNIQITHEQPRRMLEDPDRIQGVLKLERADGSMQSFDVALEPATADTLEAMAAVAADQSGGGAGPAGQSLWLIVVFALAGGVILNLMPCVFPVLSLKAMSLSSKRSAAPLEQKLHGLAYTGGVVLAFMLLASILLSLRAGGEAVGWAFQLQSPWFVALLIYLFLVMGLSLSGVYEFGTGFMGLGGNLTSKQGYKGSFFTGVLATVVASPCTAPFMGAAIGFALSQSWLVAMVVFFFLGLGMALPFLLLTWIPRLLRFMPRPGQWMETFKQFMAFPLYATALWLLWVLGIEVGINGMIAVASGGLFLALALWLLKQRRLAASRFWRHANAALVVLILVGAVAVLRLPVMEPGQSRGVAEASGGGEEASADHEPFSAARVEALRAEGRPVFVNMTAAWCITCLANERTTLSSDRVRQAMEEHDIIYMKGDWTNQDPEISRVLDEFNRPSVPLYILYPGDSAAEPRILPQILTPSLVIDAFNEL